MSITATPGATFYPSIDWNTPGATLGVRLRRVTDGVDLVARSTVGVSESPAGSGIYVLTTGMTAPATVGSLYLVEWDDTFDFVAEDLTVASTAPSIAPGVTFYPSVDWGTTGATLGVRVRRVTDGVDVVARTTAGVAESPAGSGIYVQTAGLTAPATAGAFYLIEWDDTTDYVAEGLAVSSSLPTGPDLCGLDDVKAYLQKTDTTFDSVLASLITAASAAIERYCSREFADKGTLTRTFTVNGPLVDLMPFELRAATVVTLDPAGSPVVLSADQWLASPSSRTSLGTYLQVSTSRYTYLGSALSDSFGSGEVSVTGSWGAASTPPDVAHAAVQTAALWFRREIAARATGSDLEFGEDLRPLAIPGAALRLLAPYARTVYA